MDKKGEEKLLLLEKRSLERKSHGQSSHFYTLAAWLPTLKLAKNLEKSTQSLLIGLEVAFLDAFSENHGAQLFSSDLQMLTKKASRFLGTLEKMPEAEIRLLEKLSAPFFLLGIGLISLALENGLRSKEAQEAAFLKQAPFLELITTALLSSEAIELLAKKVAAALAPESLLFSSFVEAEIIGAILIAFSTASPWQTLSPRLSHLAQKLHSILATKRERERDPTRLVLLEEALHIVGILDKALEQKDNSSFLQVVKEELERGNIKFDKIERDTKKMKEWFLTLCQEAEAGLAVKENVISFIG